MPPKTKKKKTITSKGKESVSQTVARAKAMLGSSKSKGKETVQQTVDRAKAMLGSAYNPNTKTTPISTGAQINANYAKELARANAERANQTAPSNEIKNLSIGMTQGTINDQTGVPQTTPTPVTPPTAEDYAKSILDSMGKTDVSTQGMNTQSTQGADTPVQENMVPGATGTQTPGGGTMADTTGGGSQALVSGGTPMATVATGGYQQIGPAWFQKGSDGLRAVTDKATLSGLQHGTIPSTTGQLDGTTFSKYSVPLLNPASKAVGEASLNVTGNASTVDQGATSATSYQSYQDKYGLTQDQTSFFSNPKGTISSMTEEIYKITGMDEANNAIKDITSSLEDLENKRDGEISDVNDNPWLTEGVRQRQIASIEGRYEDKIANHTNKLRLLEDVRNNAQQQAQFAIGTAISLWDKERTFQQHQIDMWNEQAQREFTNKMAIANYERGAVEFDANYAIAKFNADNNVYNATKNREVDWYNAETARINALKKDTNGLDAVTARQLQESVSANDELLRLTTKYKGLIKEKGFSYEGPFGDRATAGTLSSLRGQMVASYKKAQTLGTLDAGVIALMDSILGEAPISSTWAPLTNVTGGRQERLVSSVDSLIEGLTIQRNRDASRLGLDPIGTAPPAQIWESPSGNIYNIPGLNANSTPSS